MLTNDIISFEQLGPGIHQKNVAKNASDWVMANFITAQDQAFFFSTK